jgi:hypothetical protein
MKTTVKFFSLILFIAIGASAFVEPSIEFENTDGGQRITFPEFLSHFNKIELGYEVGLQDYKATENQLKTLQLNKKAKIKKRAQRFALIDYLGRVESSLYSRMGPPEILPVARFYPDAQTVAVIYIPYRPFGHSGNFSYKLAFFDLQGNALPKTKEEQGWGQSFILGESRLESVITFRIDKSGNVWQNHFQKIWRDDVWRKGMVNNEVLDYKATETKVFKMNPGGNLLLLDYYPTTAKAKL